MLTLLAWAEIHADMPEERRRLARWKASHPGLTGFLDQMRLELERQKEQADEDLAPQ